MRSFPLAAAVLLLAGCGANPLIREAQVTGPAPPPKVTGFTPYQEALRGDVILDDEGPGSLARGKLREAVFATARAHRAAPCDARAKARFIVAFHDYADARHATLKKNPDNLAYWMTKADYHAHQVLELQYMHGFITHEEQRRAVSGLTGWLVEPLEGGGGWWARERPVIEDACAKSQRGEPLKEMEFWALKAPAPRRQIEVLEKGRRLTRENAEGDMLEALRASDATLCGSGREAFVETLRYYYQQRSANIGGEGFRQGAEGAAAAAKSWASGPGAQIDTRLRRLAAKGCVTRRDLPYDVAAHLFG